MTRPRPFFVALPFASLLVSVLLVLCSPPDVAAQATHSGAFSVSGGGGNVIYITRLQALHPGGGLPAEPENVLVTVCPTSGLVEVRVDGNAVFSQLSFCVTRNETVHSNVGIVGNPTGSGTYSISVDLQPATKK
jgi:hypothetical protein